MNGSSFEYTWTPFTQQFFVPNLVEIDPVVMEENILKILWMISDFFKIILPQTEENHTTCIQTIKVLNLLA